MEECELRPAGRDHPWKTATLKRMAWAQSRDTWPAPESDEPLNNNNKPGTASETGPIPNKIASWLRECRTPLGASLDDQAKGPQKNGCSFEDDLSLGAEAHLLHNSSAKPDTSKYDTQAMEKRSQFRQKGRSMNSTGSGKSSGTVSSVSELLDLYEEDPEEILYNLGFGREEPDIASKIPSRFFNSSSNAKGIDIKVYLSAQMQRMELENPNYALTNGPLRVKCRRKMDLDVVQLSWLTVLECIGRFRQTEVLATVANVFSEIYSQVSGRPLQKICSKEVEPKEPDSPRKSSSTLNAVKILKRTITRPNILALAEMLSTPATNTTNSGPDGTKSVCESHSDTEHKQKIFRRKDSTLATVTEETNQSGIDVCDSETAVSKLVNGDQLPPGDAEKPEVIPDVSETRILVKEQSSGENAESKSSLIPEKPKSVSSSFTPDKEPCSFLPNPHMAHLLTQPRDSFEMEELQSNDDEAVSGSHCFSREGSEPLLRTASQQSDSSGFAEDPSTEGSTNFLKVQESSDSCDSETTVTSHAVEPGTPVSLEHPAFERLLMDEELFMQSGLGLLGPIGAEEVPERVSKQLPRHCVIDKTRPENLENAGFQIEIDDRLTGSINETSSSTESLSTVESADPVSSSDLASVPNAPTHRETTAVGEQDMIMEADSITETNSSLPSSSSTSLEPVLDNVPTPGQSSDPVPESRVHEKKKGSRVHGALLQAQQRTISCEEQRGRVWIRSNDLLRNLYEQGRNPLQRSSSLPTSLLSPTKVVSSVHIQLGQGSVQQCSPPCYSYRYEEEPEAVTSLAEEGGDKSQSRFQSDLVDSLNPDTELNSMGVSLYPINVPQHLTQSTSSLYSIPADWPLRRMAEAPVWSTASVPDLTQYTRIPYPAIPRHIQQELPRTRGPVGCPYQKPINPPSRSYSPVTSPCPYTQSGLYSQYPQPQSSPFPHPVYTPPRGSPFPQQNMAHTHPQSVPYNPSAPFHSPPFNPYGSSFNLHLQESPYSPQVPFTDSCSAPCSLAYSNTPYNPIMPYGHQCNSQFHIPPAPFPPMPAPYPSDTPTPPPTMGSTEMQLRRVLHEIRGTVQSFGQSASEQHAGTPSGVHSPRQAVQPLYEELQRRRRNLNLFRTQMMDLELALLRQQSMVYELLTPDERREAEQLQRLRVAVRQELQELEQQLEDRLLSLDDQIHSPRSSRLYRHLLDMSRGQSLDSLSSSSALRATEPVNDLLREQMYLQSELSYDGSGAINTPTSGRSSRSASPVRSSDPNDLTSPLSRRSGGVYRSTLSLTPSVPPRAVAESQDRTATPSSLPEVTAQRVTRNASEQDGNAKEPSFQEDRGGGEEVCGNVPMQQLIQQIKQSLTDEIRKEIVNELLAAVLPRRSPSEPTP